MKVPESGGNEVLEGLLLGPLLLSFARHLSREITLGLFLDPDKVDFFVSGVIRYLEAENALSPHYARAKAQAGLGSDDVWRDPGFEPGRADE